MSYSRHRRHRSRVIESKLREATHLIKRRSDLTRVSGEWVELDEPIRRGWQRYFIIRPDLVHGSDHALLRRLLTLTQCVQTSSRKDFMERDWRRGNKLVEREHHLNVISVDKYWALTDQLRAQFRLTIWRDRDTRKTHHAFELMNQWRFVQRVRPYYVTHAWVCDGDVMSELRKIDDMLYGPRWRMRYVLREYGASPQWEKHWWKDSVAPTVERESVDNGQYQLERELMGLVDDNDYDDDWYDWDDGWYDDCDLDAQSIARELK